MCERAGEHQKAVNQGMLLRQFIIKGSACSIFFIHGLTHFQRFVTVESRKEQYEMVQKKERRS